VSADDIEYVKGLGADEVIEYKRQKFEDVLAGLDAVFDSVGGETYARSIQGAEERWTYHRNALPCCGPGIDYPQVSGLTATKTSAHRDQTQRRIIQNSRSN
jgi:NADPH-dependent curcumin reductase CurA